MWVWSRSSLVSGSLTQNTMLLLSVSVHQETERFQFAVPKCAVPVMKLLSIPNPNPESRLSELNSKLWNSILLLNINVGYKSRSRINNLCLLTRRIIRYCRMYPEDRQQVQRAVVLSSLSAMGVPGPRECKS